MTKVGELGEQLIAQWLEAQDWLILAHRWRCRWGEIDLVAQHSNTLAFIEVKTRNSRNWDANGLLALTAQKQLKLQRTAALFLTQHPLLADLPCRFDLALLGYQPPPPDQPDDLPRFINSGSISWQGYQWTLHQYIKSAFDAV